MMTASENGTGLSNDIDIDALIMPDVNESEVSAMVDSLHQEIDGGSSANVPPDFQGDGVENQGITQSANNSLDLTKAIKTEGESSNVTKPNTSPQLTLNLTSTSTVSDSGRRQSFPSMSPFGGLTPQTPLTPNSQIITAEEQAAIHKQAGLLAIHSYCSKHGQAKAKEILDGVTKVKNFLTNLIQLAAKSGPHVHSSVHALVQKLVGGAISEDEFAKKIEEVLKSKHQPGLLPFLKNSITDLRQHIVLQKGIMKQLIEKKVAEKRSQQGHVPTQAAPIPTPAPITNSSQQNDNNTTQIQTTTTTTTVKPPTNAPSVSSSPGLPAALVSNVTLPGLTPQQQQLLKFHLGKFPEEQRKVYLEQVKKELEKQQNKAQIQLALQQKQLTGGGKQATNSASTNLTQQQQLSVLLKQQELIRQQQANLGLNPSQVTQISPKKGGSLSQVRKPLMSLLARRMDKEDGQSPGKSKTQENEEEEEEGMDIAGVNLKEETAHFLPSVSETVGRSIKDRTFLDSVSLKERMMVSARLHGIGDVSDDAVTYLSHAMEERLRNIMDKLTVVSRHRTESLKDDGHYQVTSDVRGQFKVLEKIDKISASRREEKEKEKIFRAAKSRSKQDDPELAKMKEQAKQLQLAQEREIHQKAANETALAAIGRRKRTATTAFGDSSTSNTSSSSDAELSLTPSSSSTSSSSQSTSSSSSSSSSSAAVAAVFSSPGPPRTKQKRKVQAKDVIFVMEQERETRRSLLLYKSLLN